MSFLAAVVQMNATSDAEANWRQALALIERAASYGAALIATPENANYLGPHAEKVRLAERLDGPTCSRFGDLAARLGVHLLLGSFNERCESDPERCRNASVLFSPTGAILAVYRKIHLFDIDLSLAGGLRFQESETVAPGDQVVAAETALGKLGMSICYDLRFSELYGALVEAGAEMIAIPSAFTVPTGRAHWEPLLRARAIERQSYVLAPGQWGPHDDRGLRESYGHSMIVDPWGQPIAHCGEGIGLAVAEIDLERVRRIRREMPVADHARQARTRWRRN